MYLDVLNGIIIGSGIIGGFFLFGFIVLYGLDYLWLQITKMIEKRRRG